MMTILTKTFDRRTALGALAGFALIAGAAAISGPAHAADVPERITVDWAYYNPVSLVLKEQGLLEQEFTKEGTEIRWVQSHGSNKAIEFLNAGSVDFGSTAGAAALLAHINGAPIDAIYVYSKPEWTALVTGKDSPINAIADLKGKRIAVTRGTDPHIFLIRALASAGLTERDVKTVLLQHADGARALQRGDVDAWAGLDPMMASTQVDSGARLFYRNADLNTYGFLNVRTAFAEEYPKAVERVLATYETARKWSIANPDKLAAILQKAAGVTEEVAKIQLGERTDLSNPVIGPIHIDAITQAGIALQSAGVIAADVDVAKQTQDLIDTRFAASLPSN